MCLTSISARVSIGSYHTGHQIKVQGVTQALAAIRKTVEMAGLPNPIYCAPQKYHLQIEIYVEGMRRKDPPVVPQLSVPVIVPEEMTRASYADDCPKEHAIVDLGVISFYYLLWVGEYTKPRMTTLHGKKVRATRTVQFVGKDVGFFKMGYNSNEDPH